MAKSSTVLPRLLLHQRLGEVLRQAALVSQAQIEVALHDQQEYLEMRLGEILALRGWLKQDTADFFAEQWQALVREVPKDRIGTYLKRAGLLSETQIKTVLDEQKRTGYRFGALVVLNGWITQQTLDFFLDSLYPGKKQEAPFIQKTRAQSSPKQPAPLFIDVPKENVGPAGPSQPLDVPKRDATIPWID